MLASCCQNIFVGTCGLWDLFPGTQALQGEIVTPVLGSRQLQGERFPGRWVPRGGGPGQQPWVARGSGCTHPGVAGEHLGLLGYKPPFQQCRSAPLGIPTGLPWRTGPYPLMELNRIRTSSSTSTTSSAPRMVAPSIQGEARPMTFCGGCALLGIAMPRHTVVGNTVRTGASHNQPPHIAQT